MLPLIVLFTTLFIQSLSAQGIVDCQDTQNYVPDNPLYTPLFRVRLVLHIFQKDDGSGNFKSTPADLKFINWIIEQVNDKYRNLDTFRLPTSSIYIRDSRVTFVVDTILFHRDTYAWDLYCHNRIGEQQRKCDSIYKKYVLENSMLKYRTDAIHAFWGEGCLQKDCPAKGLADGIGSGRWFCVINTYYFYQQNPPNSWIPAGNIRHELAHMLGLFHPISYNPPGKGEDYCEDTPNYPEDKGCWNGPDCSNNMAGYNADQSSLTACQLGRIHYYLAGNAGSLHNAVIPDWCTYNKDSVVLIPAYSRVVWKAKKFFQGDIRIARNATLQVHCQLHLPHNAKIYLEPNARLIVDGGIITNVCEKQQWGGIIVLGKKKNRKEAVKLLNGGSLERSQFIIQYQKPVD
ncbi:MAG: hypothetical protein RML72_12690 [Bacteroidia bacterium]|nr:hypothetical protein [Bacteroidia bacterium]MDW8159716.1 hypothetical protein [Bacteroidia bacterium]